jgi:hypothetical protein
VDRCARIEAFCSPGQILLDETLFQVVKAHIIDYPDILPGKSFQVEAKGLGLVELYEVSLQGIGLVNRIMTPFSVHADGRRSISEKVHFISQAESEIVEVGTGLTSFAKYFTGQKPNEWRTHIRNLIRRGVSVKCYAVHPNYQPAKGYLNNRGEERYRDELLRSRTTLLEERKYLLSQGYDAQLHYFAYKCVPSFHCLCVDGADARNGRMLFPPYLPGLSRAETPVCQVSRIASPDLFEKFWRAVQAIQSRSEGILK